MQSNQRVKQPIDEFPSTRWSLVLAVGGSHSVDSDRALASLCQAYWYPVYAYIRRRKSSEDAKDLTQEFFVQVLERDLFGKADATRGRFRAFLLTAVKHFLTDQWKKTTAQKRGGGRTILSIDFEVAEERYSHEPEDDRTPDRLFQQQWVLAVLDRVFTRLQSEYDTAGRNDQFDRLSPFITGQTEGLTHKQVAQTLGITEQAARAAVHRLRKRYRELLRGEIAQTVESEDEVDNEVRALFSAFD